MKGTLMTTTRLFLLTTYVRLDRAFWNLRRTIR